MPLQCLSTINMVFNDEDKIFIKSFYLKGYTGKRLTDEFPEKRWTKGGRFWDTVYIQKYIHYRKKKTKGVDMHSTRNMTI